MHHDAGDSFAGGRGVGHPRAAVSAYDAEGRFRAIFHGTFQFIGLLDPLGNVMEVNRAALDLVGAEADAIIGRAFWETPWWDEEQRERLRDAVGSAARGSFVRYEAEHHGADGRIVAVDFSLTPLTDADGRVTAIVAEGRDVTDRRRAERELRLSEARLSGILDIAADAIITVDETQTITLFNQGAETIFGYTAGEMIGRPLDMLIPEAVCAVHRKHIEDFARSSVPARRMGERAEVRGRRKNGEIFPAEASISKLEVDGNRFFTAVLRDVTQQHRAQQERARLLEREREARTAAEAAERRASFLAEAGELLGSSLEYEATLTRLARLAVPFLADCCIVDVVDESGALRRLEVAHASTVSAEVVEALRAYRLREDRPHLTRDALAGADATLVAEVTEAYLRSVAQSESHLALLRALELRSLMIVPLVARGDVLGAIVFGATSPGRRYGPAELTLARDLARRAQLAMDNARLYREARRAIQAREDVLGVVSHDLRNPLSVIAMCAAMLEDSEAKEPHSAADLLGTIRQSADWMNRLIQDLLDIARIEAGQLAIERRPEDLVRVVAEAVMLLEPLAQDKEIRLREELPEYLPAVLADGRRVIQVLSNLVGNAIKFTPRHGTITVRVTPADGEVQIAVSDSGGGISADHLPHVFDGFWQAPTAAREKGAGLGLAIARGIVEAHGGRIWAESEPERGSTFTFTLPLAG